MTHRIKTTDDTLQQTGFPLIAILLCAAFALVLYFHLRGIGGEFLSDDFVHAKWIADAQGQRELLNWLFERFYLPLDSGNYAYRPVVFASYALDWAIYGNNATGWHLTNLLIHLLNGILILFLAGRLAVRMGAPDSRFIATAVATLFIAIPFAGESTFWPVGRFDLLACSFSLVFLLLLTGTPTRHGLLRALAIPGSLLLALLSKESAMPMLAVGFVLVFAIQLTNQRSGVALWRAATRNTFAQYWPVFAMAFAYFSWRFYIFGSPWKVYPDSHLPVSLDEAISRVSVLKYVIIHPYAQHAWLWWSLIILGVLTWLTGLSAALKRASFSSLALVVVFLCCFVAYLLAPATSFPVATVNGEGIRNLYFPWVMFSLFAGFFIAHHRLRAFLLCVVLVIAFNGQWRMLTLWQDAAWEMSRLTTAVPALASEVDDSQYALLLLPDHVSAVPFARNAQAAVVMPPRQTVSYLSKMAAMTPLQFNEWEQHLGSNKIGVLKGNGERFERTLLLGVYCWVPSRAQFELLQTRPRNGDAESWQTATMKEAGDIGCLL